LDRPTRPSVEFSEQLFEGLVHEATRRPAPVPVRYVLGGRRDLRRVLIVAAVLIVTIAILAVVLGPLRSLGTKKPASPTPSTSFVATYEGSFPASSSVDRGGDFRIQVSYRDSDAWRIDVLGGSAASQPLINENVAGAGSYVVWSNGTLTGYDASSGRSV